MQVNLTYFKGTGKYYSDGTYETQLTDLSDIWSEVRLLRKTKLPGLTGGWLDGPISVDVPDHPHNHPRLIMPE